LEENTPQLVSMVTTDPFITDDTSDIDATNTDPTMATTDDDDYFWY
jgi:hypothetical protein